MDLAKRKWEKYNNKNPSLINNDNDQRNES